MLIPNSTNDSISSTTEPSDHTIQDIMEVIEQRKTGKEYSPTYFQTADQFKLVAVLSRIDQDPPKTSFFFEHLKVEK